MALTIESPEAERLARELAERTGASVAEAVTDALRAALARRSTPMGADAMRILRESAERIGLLPVLDSRSADEILGYDENGLPT
jgi:antitoxin VapB